MALVSDAIIEKIAEMEADIRDLRGMVASQDKVITGMKHYMKVAADYHNDDPAQVLAAIQAALGKASAYSKMRKIRTRKGS